MPRLRQALLSISSPRESFGHRFRTSNTADLTKRPDRACFPMVRQALWRESGLYAVDVEWTERASSMITNGEYRYISPVFTYDKKTGAIKKVLHAALTSNPALDGMDAVTDVAALEFSHLFDESQKESLSMEKLLKELRWMMNLPVTATQRCTRNF